MGTNKLASLREGSIRHFFRLAGERQGWWETNHPVIAAVSGGGDSVCLLWLLRKFWSGHIVVAHMEHGIRGDSSLHDARFVEHLAADWKLDCAIAHCRVGLEKRPGESIEDCARRLRYDFFGEVRRRYDAEWVLLGHNANDIAETVLFHLLRGTGLRGLVGIPETRDFYARPLVDFQRQELREILKMNGIHWVDDETNLDENYTRNFIRRSLIPLIRERINPAAEKHLSALAREVSPLVQKQEEEATSLLDDLRTPFPVGERTWSLKAAQSLSPDVLARCVRREGRDLDLPSLSRRRTTELVHLISKGGHWQFQWKGDMEVCCGKGLIGWRRQQPPALMLKTFTPKLHRGNLVWGEWLLTWEWDATPDQESDMKPLTYSFSIVLPPSGIPDVTLRDLARLPTESKPHPSVPWWAEKGWPVLSIGSTMTWSPDPDTPLQSDSETSFQGKWFKLSLTVADSKDEWE